MANDSQALVPVYLPAELVAKMEDLKQDREEEKTKSVQELILAYCESFVRRREASRRAADNLEELERSYQEQPYDDPWPGADEWVVPPQEEGKP